MNQEKLTNKDTKFIRMILNFYTKHGRHDLMWRKNITPYRILVSEIMLQQTQVSRVLPKFAIWMKRYPTLTALRKATLQDVLIIWQGLGYQRRAKALFTIAQENNILPKTFEKVIELPGVGNYTASAVLAFGYNEFSNPMIETNIRTALIEEYYKCGENISDSMLQNDLIRLTSSDTVQKVGARVWYYALMDYGAHLKENKISHNTKSKHNVVAIKYKGSSRELRAKILFAIVHKNELPEDDRTQSLVQKLIDEKFITKKGKKFLVAE